MALKQYTVKAGDTASQIAKNYGVDLNAVSGYKSGDANKIGVGEVLSINTPDTPPANRINAADLGGTPLVAPPTVPSTGAVTLQSLAESTKGKIDALTPDITADETSIRSAYDKLGKKSSERAAAYANEVVDGYGVTVNQASKELQDINNKIKQKELAHRRKIERIQEENPTGQLSEGQRLAIEKADREWAREAADLSLVAEVKMGNYEGAKAVIDDRITAETEDLTTRLAGLEFFYSKNYNRLTDLQKTQLQQETDIVKQNLADKKELLAQIGDLQIEAARNGAGADTISRIGRAETQQEAITAAGSYIGLLDRQREARLSGGGSGGSYDFSKTQVAKGAAAAGVSLEEFQSYDSDTQNFFINSINDAQSAIDDEFKNGATIEEIQSGIAAAGLPQGAIDYLNNYAQQQYDSNYRQLTPEEQYSDIVGALTSYKDQGYSRDEAYDAEYAFQTTDEKGKDLGLPKSQLKKIESNIKDAQVEVYGQTFWQWLWPGGR